MNIKELYKGTGYLTENKCLFKISDCQNIGNANKAGKANKTLLSNFVPVIIEEISRDDGVETSKHFVIGGQHSNGSTLPLLNVPASEFNGMGWILKGWGVKCNISPKHTTKDYIRHAIQSAGKGIENKVIYTHTGWRKIGEFWSYLSSNYSIGAKDITVELDGKLSKYSLTDISKIENINEIIFRTFEKLFDKKFCSNEIIFPLLGIAFLSPLNEVLKEANCEPKLLLFLIGKTGAKKSTLAALILSFFGNFTNTDLPMSFRDTANSIIHQAFSLKDTLTVIDDYHPSSKGDEYNMSRTAQTVMRAYGDRIGRNRLKSDSSLMSAKPPRGNAILTGETPPDVTESGTARYIAVELKAGDINVDLLTELQNSAKNGDLNITMSCYIQYLANMINQTSFTGFGKRLDDMFRDKRSEIARRLKEKNIEAHARIPEAIAWLHLGFYMFGEFLVATNIITSARADELYKENDRILLGLAEEQSKNVVEDKPSMKFATKLEALINSEGVQIIPLSKSDHHKYNNFVGYEDDEYFYLVPDITHKAVKRLCDEQGHSFPTNPKTLLKHLETERIIEVSKDSRTKLKTVNGKAQRFMWIKKTAFYNLIK